ncbi:hypothetical protein HZS_5187 [Henneguya salminicola]|nr:hypothetical protein HZS_5187 [Henneguya salminicola]
MVLPFYSKTNVNIEINGNIVTNSNNKLYVRQNLTPKNLDFSAAETSDENENEEKYTRYIGLYMTNPEKQMTDKVISLIICQRSDWDIPECDLGIFTKRLSCLLPYRVPFMVDIYFSHYKTLIFQIIIREYIGDSLAPQSRIISLILQRNIITEKNPFQTCIEDDCFYFFPDSNDMGFTIDIKNPNFNVDVDAAMTFCSVMDGYFCKHEYFYDNDAKVSLQYKAEYPYAFIIINYNGLYIPVAIKATVGSKASFYATAMSIKSRPKILHVLQVEKVYLKRPVLMIGNTAWLGLTKPKNKSTHARGCVQKRDCLFLLLTLAILYRTSEIATLIFTELLGVGLIFLVALKAYYNMLIREQRV